MTSPGTDDLTTPRTHSGPLLSTGEQWDVMDCQD